VQVSRRQLIKGPCLPQELEAMEYVSANTSVCLPRIHRTYTRRDGLYIAMDYVPGDRLDHLWPQISGDEKRKLVFQVQEVVAKLHECAPPVAPQGIAVASANGGPVSDGAFGIEGHQAMMRGPFQDLEAFENFLVDNPNAQGFERSPGRISFVHADLAPRSIIRKPNGELCIINWDFAGWWPICKLFFFPLTNMNSNYPFPPNLIQFH
jgi:serine/threonine protein kinase